MHRHMSEIARRALFEPIFTSVFAQCAARELEVAE
jgi:hypothetical protein